MRRTPLLARRLTLAALAGALAALAACEGGELTGLRTGGGGIMVRGTTGGAGGSQTSSIVVGRWWRIVTFSSGGAARTSETTWDFYADGTAQRTLVTTNVTEGVADVLVWEARWATAGDEIEITYTYPVTGAVRFRWRVERGFEYDVLYLDDTWFRRIR